MKIIKVTSQKELEQKQEEMPSKIAAYREAQVRQLQNGGPGPVADYEVMAIANEHNGKFIIELEEQTIPELEEQTTAEQQEQE
jgi:hypothetical protein